MLADLLGMSEDWLSRIERGERDIRRLDRLADVARELRLSLGDLLRRPVLMEDDEDRDDIPRVRDALTAPRPLSRVQYQAAPALENIITSRLWSWWSPDGLTTNAACSSVWSTRCRSYRVRAAALEYAASHPTNDARAW